MPNFTPLHRDLTFIAPLSEARADRLVAFLAEGEPSTVLADGLLYAGFPDGTVVSGYAPQ